MILRIITLPYSCVIETTKRDTEREKHFASEAIVMATLGGIREVEGSANSVEIDGLARFAVDEHNKKENALLEFKKVVKAREQVVAGTMYYLTLEATDGGVKKVYEAKVWVKPWENFKELQEFKLIGDASSSDCALLSN